MRATPSASPPMSWPNSARRRSASVNQSTGPIRQGCARASSAARIAADPARRVGERLAALK
jgi:hypothetical protein